MPTQPLDADVVHPGQMQRRAGLVPHPRRLLVLGWVLLLLGLVLCSYWYWSVHDVDGEPDLLLCRESAPGSSDYGTARWRWTLLDDECTYDAVDGPPARTVEASVPGWYPAAVLAVTGACLLLTSCLVRPQRST